MAEEKDLSSGEEIWQIVECNKCAKCWKGAEEFFMEGADGKAQIHTHPKTTGEKAKMAGIANICPVGGIKLVN